MTFSGFNVTVEDLRAYTDTVQMNINHLSLTDKSGFTLKDFSSGLHLSKQQLYFDDVDFTTARSKMAFRKIHFDVDSFKDFGQGGILSKVKMNIGCDKAELFLDELGYFAKVFENLDNKIELAGAFYGTIANLNARNLEIRYSENTLLKGKFDIIGLPDSKSTFLIFDTREFKTTTEEINSFKLPDNKKIDLPDRFSEIDYYSYKGNFTGFFRDFVSYGTIETNLGAGNIDISFKPDSANAVVFSGRINSRSFNLGPLTGLQDKIGNATFNLVINGKGKVDEGFDVNLAGAFDNFEINSYDYESIEVDGSFSKQRFNGKLEINDPNLRMNFNGLLDLSSSIRKYDFTANVLKANLFPLHINKKDPNYTASFLVHANLSGNQVDDINGEVKLLNSLFTKSEAQIQVYDLLLQLQNDSLQNKVVVNSDFLDGEIVGHFKLTQLVDEYIQLADTYMPSLGLVKERKQLLAKSDFKYQLSLKNSEPLFAFFTPNYMLNPNSVVEGELKRDETLTAKLHLQSPKVKLNNSEIENMVLNSFATDTSISMDFGCSEFDLSRRISFDNFTLFAHIDSNRIDFNSRWLNWDSTLHKGGLKGNLAFNNLPGQKLKANLNVDSSFFIISDSVWVLSPVNILIDSSRITVDDFKLAHNGEYFKAWGELTEAAGDSLHFDFKDFNFGNLNFFTRSSTFKFGGILNGQAQLHGFKRPLFFASLNVKSLELNDELLGDTYIESQWNSRKESIEIEADILRGMLKTLEINGDIYPRRNGQLDLALNFEKFRLNFINPYLNTVFSDIRGLASGYMTLTGTAGEPKLNGDLKLQKAALTVDYLKTRYNFTSDISITNNNIVFDGVELFDKYINTATLNGMIRTEYLKNFNLNLSLQPQNFYCLNTTQEDNQSFFGQAFASGLIRITGPTSALKFDIRATTEPGTEFNIPLSGSEELSEYDFIRIITADTLTESEEKEEYKVNLSGMQLDFNLNVTPEAEVKIIFDPTMGDEISTRGNGDLRIAINSLGDFKMIGDYVIESGTYLFTLRDVINKRFKVEQGSSLQWSGDPVNANINISTFYRTKASLADLTGDPNSTYRYTIDCKLGLSGKLMEPVIQYDIHLPFAEQEQRDQLSAAIHSNEEMGKQFLSLLVLNRFLLKETGENSGFDNTNIAGVNASELLSNQVSNWLSQISDEFDIGVNYRPGTDISPQELEVALSTQLLNDRLSINGSVDMKTNAEADQANDILGNLDVDYKITRSGKLRARAYNRANDNELVNYSKYTQGVGVFYTEEFDKFNEIGSWYRKNKNEKKKNRTATKKQKEAVREEEIQEQE
jgi:hypothetical protein